MTWDRYKREGADGRAMCKLDNRTWWQSRMSKGGRAELPDLVDLEELARKLWSVPAKLREGERV